MSLPWVRLDTNFPTHDKTLELLELGPAGRSAAFVYLCGLAYAGLHGTDGRIPFTALRFIHGTKKDAELLVGVALWKPHPQGWEIPNWLERQQSTARAHTATTHRRRGAAKANCIRWHGPDCHCWSDPDRSSDSLQ